MFRIILAVGLILAGAAWVAAQPQPQGEPKLPDNVAKAKEVVVEHLQKIKGTSGTVAWIGDEAVTKTFPHHVFFAVRFRIYPIAKQLPEGLRASNIFVVKDGKLEHLKDAKALEAFFKDHAAAAAKSDAARAAVRSWLTLSQEFVQDGYFAFEITKEMEVVGKEGEARTASGRAIVMKGGNGDITVFVNLDKNGKVESVMDKTMVKAGPRPICQATKLLDADPIVRKMAEEDLLYMGLAARDYLMEQRASARPELQSAIDHLWARIVKKGW
jgi:hypothetical protein